MSKPDVDIFDNYSDAYLASNVGQANTSFSDVIRKSIARWEAKRMGNDEPSIAVPSPTSEVDEIMDSLERGDAQLAEAGGLLARMTNGTVQTPITTSSRVPLNTFSFTGFIRAEDMARDGYYGEPGAGLTNPTPKPEAEPKVQLAKSPGARTIEF